MKTIAFKLLLIGFVWLPFPVEVGAQYRPDIQGHRGCRGLMPENTIPAFLKAMDLGVSTLECDVVITGDNQVLVSHDPYMNATFCLDSTGQPIDKPRQKEYRIFGMTMDQVRKFDCGSLFHPDFPEQAKMKVYKPLLSEMLQAAETYAREKGLTPVRYNIEIKCSPEGDGTMHPTPEIMVERVMEVIGRSGIGNRFNIQSFDIRPLRILHEKYPDVRLAYLVANVKSVKANLDDLGFRPDIYSPYHLMVTEKTVKQCHTRGMLIIPWTVNSRKDMDKLLELGVDGIITDYPNLYQ